MGYPAVPVGVEADEVVDGGDGVEEDEIDAHEHQQPRHRPRAVRHLSSARPFPPPFPESSPLPLAGRCDVRRCEKREEAALTGGAESI